MRSIAGSHKNEYVLFRPARCEQLDRTLIATGFLVAVGGQELDNVRQRAGPIGATEPAPLKLLRRATGGDAPERFCISFGSRGSRQREDRKLAAERGVVAQRGITAHCAQAVMRIGETSGKADPGPAAYTGQHGDVLLATVLVGHHVADDTRWRLELVQLLAGLGINRRVASP